MGKAKKPPSTRKIVCPDCGLILRATDQARGFKFVYDMSDWRRICARVHLGDAAWCLIQRDGTYKLPLAMDGGDDLHFEGWHASGASD